MNKTFNTENAFTLIEVAIAIAILGIGLMTISSLTTRLMNDTLEEINRTHSSFFGQYILETVLADRFNNESNNANSQASSSGSLYEKLQAMNYFEGINSQNLEYTRSWTYDLKVENINLPLEVPATYEKYSLTISWGTLSNQFFHIETIKKSKESETPQSQDGGEDEDV